MSETTPDSNASTEKDDVKDTGTGESASDSSSKVETDKPKEDDTAALKKALTKERQRAEKAEKAIKDAELAKMPEIDQLKTQVSDLTEANRKLARENLQYKVGSDEKLPSRFWKKIDGETEEEMRADAAAMLKDLKLDDLTPDKDKKDGRKQTTNDGRKAGGTGKADMNSLLRAAAGL